MVRSIDGLFVVNSPRGKQPIFPKLSLIAPNNGNSDKSISVVILSYYGVIAGWTIKYIIPTGFIFSFLFFLLLFFAALTSMISLLEVAVTFFIDEFHLTRPVAACLAGAIVTILGIPSAYSLAGPDASVFGRNIFINRNFFDFIDYISNNILMPATAIGICVFVGWVWAESARKEITNNGLTPFPPVDLWLWSARLVAPIAIGLILYSGI